MYAYLSLLKKKKKRTLFLLDLLPCLEENRRKPTRYIDFEDPRSRYEKQKRPQKQRSPPLVYPAADFVSGGIQDRGNVRPKMSEREKDIRKGKLSEVTAKIARDDYDK